MSKKTPRAQEFTGQIGGSHKVAVFGSWEEFCMCPLSYSFAAEGSYGYHFTPQNLYQVTYTAPLSSRLLFEAGYTRRVENHLVDNINGAGNAISVRDQLLGVYGSVWSSSVSSRGVYGDHGNQGQQSTRFALSYVTGSHALKVGATTFTGTQNIGGPDINNNSNVQPVLRGGVPVSINLAAYPHQHVSKVGMDLGLYAQDNWTVDQLTLNLGVRFDYLNGYNPAQCRPAGQFTESFCFERLDNVPNWKDISPAGGRRLRPVRRRPNRAQGVAGPVCETVNDPGRQRQQRGGTDCGCRQSGLGRRERRFSRRLRCRAVSR